jgi:hypothetical protein
MNHKSILIAKLYKSILLVYIYRYVNLEFVTGMPVFCYDSVDYHRLSVPKGQKRDLLSEELC